MAFGIPCKYCNNSEELHVPLGSCKSYEPENPIEEMRIYSNNRLLPKNARIENSILNLSNHEISMLEFRTKKPLAEIIDSFKQR